MEKRPEVVVLICAEIEWQAIRACFPDAALQTSPLGPWFVASLPGTGSQAPPRPVLFFHGGWGKIAAAASTQYVIDRWHPALLLNLGTCGGFEGEIERDTLLLVERTVVYDIIEQMGDPDESIAHYATEIDLTWLEGDYPQEVRRSLLVSADRDLLVTEIADLKRRYGAIAGDWESGAIAYVAARNGTRLLISRAVTDLVGSRGGEAYGNLQFFTEATTRLLRLLVEALPRWIARGLTPELPTCESLFLR